MIRCPVIAPIVRNPVHRHTWWYVKKCLTVVPIYNHWDSRGLSKLEAFWKFVDKQDEQHCWKWLGSSVGNWLKYGQFLLDGYNYKAHKLSWMIAHETDIPIGYEIRHTCDNSVCVSPWHLLIGTHKNNMQDMVMRGRAAHQFGVTHGLSTLTIDDVKYIRHEYDMLESSVGVHTINLFYYECAKKLSVSSMTVRRVAKRETYPGVEYA